MEISLEHLMEILGLKGVYGLVHYARINHSKVKNMRNQHLMVFSLCPGQSFYAIILLRRLQQYVIIIMWLNEI